ncbi:MAG: HAD family hydrolase [Bacteroidota bacterium]
MTLTISPNSIIVFDLDDTLYKEIDFLKSAYVHIAKLLEKNIGKNIYEEMIALYLNKESTFDIIKSTYSFPYTIKDLVEIYRFHKPTIQLNQDVFRFINSLRNAKIPLGLITDGRSLSQRNKLNALGLTDAFEIIVISEEIGSEKPDVKNYRLVEDNFKGGEFTYIGDNFQKDFVTPNQLSWNTIGIKDNGLNIHKQSSSLPLKYHPKFLVDSFDSITIKFLNK